MNRKLIEKYIQTQPIKVVTKLDLDSNVIQYGGIIQGREIKVITGDEELSRAYLITRLVNELGYPSDCIEIEHEYTAGRPHTITSRIDVIVRDRHGNAFLFIECKSPQEYASIVKEDVIEEQLYKVAGMEETDGRKHKVKYLVLYTTGEARDEVFDECLIINKDNFPVYSDWEKGRDFSNKIPAGYGKSLKVPYVKGSAKDLDTSFTNEMIAQLQSDLHNVLWGGGGTDDNEVFSSLVNLILAKIQDEDEKDDGQKYDFQSLCYESGGGAFETNKQLFDRINMLYRRALRAKLYISDGDELSKSFVVDTKKFALSKLKYAVQKLEGLSFVDGKNSLSGKDILGDFFEGIIRNGFKQSKGQFFTHVNVVNFMLYGIQADRLAIKRIREDLVIPYMIDPSAGSGTFLIGYMKFITRNIKYRNQNSSGYNKALGTARNVKDRVLTDWFYPDYRENRWAQTFIYGTEINFNLGTATKVNMILHGDGSTNIFVKDGLLPFDRYEKETAPNVLHDSAPDNLYGAKGLNFNANGRFDLILTNPPFSVDLDPDTKKTLKRNFLFGDKKNSENLFVERWYQLLREHGRVAAVLPESVFDIAENKYIRVFLFKYFNIKAVVSLPELTFEPFTPTKTSILFAQKKARQEIDVWNQEWNDASRLWQRLKTRVENLVSVYKTGKLRKSYPSIRDMSKEEEKEVLLGFLRWNLRKNDSSLSPAALIEKYDAEIKTLCEWDKDLSEAFGRVNIWWVFSAVSQKINYPIFMAEADNVGYKRYTKNRVVCEKHMPNDLFREIKGDIQVDDGVKETILDYMRDIQWD